MSRSTAAPPAMAITPPGVLPGLPAPPPELADIAAFSPSWARISRPCRSLTWPAEDAKDVPAWVAARSMAVRMRSVSAVKFWMVWSARSIVKTPTKSPSRRAER